ncbi:MAG TPA: hypothetical protein VEH06_14590 [Candidatus Bathyarchaeia archaeon]|nr:hypothetical protein [Candidatus Bathyarchaeia archaeon]
MQKYASAILSIVCICILVDIIEAGFRHQVRIRLIHNTRNWREGDATNGLTLLSKIIVIIMQLPTNNTAAEVVVVKVEDKDSYPFFVSIFNISFKLSLIIYLVVH